MLNDSAIWKSLQDTRRFTFVALSLGVCLSGCSRSSPLDPQWSAPVAFTNAECYSLTKWNGTLITRETNSFWLILRANGSNWARVQLPGSEKHFPVVMSELSDTGFLERSALTADKERLDIDLYQIARTSDLFPRRLGTSQVSLNRIDLFGGRPTNSPPRLELNSMTRCGSGSAVGDAIFIPYAALTDLVTVNSAGKVQTFMGNNSAEVGVLSSTNAGRSWDRTKVFGYESYQPVIRSTKANTFLFADEKSRLLRSSTRSPVTGNWLNPEMVTVTVAMGGGYIAESSADTVHVCWLDDRRKSGLGFFVYGDFAGSYRNKQVFYRQKKDGDTAWSKEKLLSSGLSYVGSITMTAEGSKIVIAWQNREGREVYPKAGIYFTTSKDNGRTWTKYRRVTGIDESSAENPRVALLHDTIHLFYNQTGGAVYRQCSFPVD